MRFVGLFRVLYKICSDNYMPFVRCPRVGIDRYLYAFFLVALPFCSPFFFFFFVNHSCVLFHFQSTMIPATVNVNRLATHLTNLEEGSVYSLTGFEVTRCNQNYRLSDSSLLIRFTDSTSFKKVTEPAVPIPLESFRFRNYSEMLGLANSNNQLPGNAPLITSSDYIYIYIYI